MSTKQKGKCSMCCCVPVILCNAATVEGGVGAAFFVGLKRLIGPTGRQGQGGRGGVSKEKDAQPEWSD